MRFCCCPLLAIIALSTGCGVDAASANGELGRMKFTLMSDYYLSEHALDDSSIVTNHEQFFGVGLTGTGEADIGSDADEIVWEVTPDEGVDLNQSGADEDSGEDDSNSESVRGFSVLVEEPGSYQVEALLNGEAVERIHLIFDTPASLELVLHTRAPYEENFSKVANEGSLTVAEGTQLAWLPIPLTDTAERMLGDIDATMVGDPAEAVVPAANVEHVNEDEVQTFFRADSLYFIEAGAVNVTITDEPNAVVGTVAFVVE